MVGVLLDREAEYAPHVEALGAPRGDSRDQFRRDGTAAALRPAIEDGLHFILALGLIVGDPTGVNQALQRIGRLAPVEHTQQLPAEDRIDNDDP